MKIQYPENSQGDRERSTQNSPHDSSKSSTWSAPASRTPARPPPVPKSLTNWASAPPNAAEEHLQALARKGVIELLGGTSRGIRLRSDALRALNESRESRSHQFSLPIPSLAQLNLPLVGRVAAGAPILAQEHIEQNYNVEASMFSRRPDFLLRVRGMSMKDIGIMDGDLLAVQKASEARNGQIIVARLGDEVTVKRFKRGKQGIELLPENPDFEPIVVQEGDESFALEGLAVGLIRGQMFS